AGSAAHPATGTLHVIEPPFARDLRDYLGGLEPANNYLSMVRELHRKAFASASALKQLADRYPASTLDRFPPALRSRVEQLASANAEDTRTATRDYLAAMQPLLHEMSRRSADAPIADLGTPSISPDASACPAWQPVSIELASQLLVLQDSFRR